MRIGIHQFLRQSFRAGAGGLIVASTTVLAFSAEAAAPFAKAQAPGFYRTTLGDFEVTTILDGTVTLDAAQLLTHVGADRVKTLLERQFLTTSVETSVNAFLINTGTKLVLVDTGAGKYFGPTVGKLLTNLQAAGYTPEQIDDVVITHLHSDHIGGLMTDGHRTFPNAVLHVDQHDVNYWLSQSELDKAPIEAKSGFENAIASVKPYMNANKFHAFESGERIVPGIVSVPAHGHSPGHTLYSIESRGEKLMLWGDLVHVAAVQFPEPKATVRFDSDADAAAAQRLKALREASTQGYWIAAAHAPFPGLGHVRLEAGGHSYRWTPANYKSNQN